jgi:hypothetical protein
VRELSNEKLFDYIQIFAGIQCEIHQNEIVQIAIEKHVLELSIRVAFDT